MADISKVKLPDNTTYNLKDANAYALTGGTELASNTDLDSIVTPGNYYCSSSATAKTITNTPYGTLGSSSNLAFILKVGNSLGDSSSTYLYQELRYYSQSWWFSRTTNNSGSTWSSWESSIGLTNSVAANGHMFLYLGIPASLFNIPSGADLNDYTTGGVYKSASSAITVTLTNRPPFTDAGFKLIVDEMYSTSGIVQIAICASSICIRTKGSSGWLAWKHLTKPAESTIDGLMGAADRVKLDDLSGIHPVIGTQTESTGVWTGSINVAALYDGLTIAYYVPYAVPSSTNVSLKLTLSDGTTTPEVPVYTTNNSRATTHYGAGSTVILTYWGAGSISVAGTATTEARWTRADYNSNTDTKVRQSLVSGNANRPLLMAYSANTVTTANVDNVAYRNNSIYANPSTGKITANGFVGNLEGTVNGFTVAKSVPSDAVFTDTTYAIATTSANGLMSSSDKTRLNGISSSYNASTETLTINL